MMKCPSTMGSTAQDYFTCIECLTPSATVYRQFSPSPSSVKLTRCIACRKDVDPYVEREWILVFLDIILHRLSANRHLYLHHRAVTTTNTRNSTSNASSVSTSSVDVNDSLSLSIGTDFFSWIQYTILVTVLDAYLKCQVDVVPSMEHIRKTSLFVLLVSSLVEHLVQVSTIFILSSILLCWMTKPGRRYYYYLTTTTGVFHKLIRGISLPAIYMRLIVSCILIWENTVVVRGLGALLILSQQCLSFFCILEYEIGTVKFLMWIMEQQSKPTAVATTVRSSSKSQTENNHTNTINSAEELSFWVNLYLKNDNNPSKKEQPRDFNRRSAPLIVSSLLSVVTSVTLRSLVSLYMSRLCHVPLLCTGFYVVVGLPSESQHWFCLG